MKHCLVICGYSVFLQLISSSFISFLVTKNYIDGKLVDFPESVCKINNEGTNSFDSFPIFIFSLYFQSISTGDMDLWTLLWMVVITDFVIKFSTVIVKSVIALLPKYILPYKKKVSTWHVSYGTLNGFHVTFLADYYCRQ